MKYIIFTFLFVFLTSCYNNNENIDWKNNSKIKTESIWEKNIDINTSDDLNKSGKDIEELKEDSIKKFEEKKEKYKAEREKELKLRKKN